MSQGQQPMRPLQGGLEQPQRQQGQGERTDRQEPIKYGDVFNVSGDLSTKPVAPEDANMMQSAETMVFGQTQKGGAAATMQSAASGNEQCGFVGHRDATDTASERSGVAVTKTDVPGARIVTERVAGQVVGQYVETTPVQGLTAAEVRATGSNVIVPGGLAGTAQSAASHNAATNRDNEKIKLTDVLTGATERLRADKVVTRADAEGIVNAELRNNPSLTTHPGGVAASMTTAARLNENVNV